MIQTRQRWQTNAPHLPTILMATAVPRSNTDGIAQCGMSKATLEATECCHWASTCSILPQRPPGQQADKQQWTNTPTKLAVLMAMALCRYVAAHIAWWKRSRASLKATGRHHWVSIMSDNIKGTWLQWFFLSFFIIETVGKGHGLTLRPLFLIGVWHIKWKRRAYLRWVYNLLGGLRLLNNIWISGLSIAFTFLNAVSRSHTWDIN